MVPEQNKSRNLMGDRLKAGLGPKRDCCAGAWIALLKADVRIRWATPTTLFGPASRAPTIAPTFAMTPLPFGENDSLPTFR